MEKAPQLRPIPTINKAIPLTQTLGVIVGTYKSVVTKAINSLRGPHGPSIWQRNYHDHIIRDARDLSNKRHYITQNPDRWTRRGDPLGRPNTDPVQRTPQRMTPKPPPPTAKSLTPGASVE